jgi:hypothetical protein
MRTGIEGMAADNMRWSANMGKNDLEIIDHKIAISKYGLVNINNQITHLNRIVYDERQMYIRL